MRKTAALIGALLCIGAPARADFIDTTWRVTAFAGEAWFAKTELIIGRTQEFYKGFAQGVFYACDYEGQSATYTSYDVESFLANPEFATFAAVADALRADGGKVFVHRISCNGKNDPARRRTLYPFVTTDTREQAWHLFEGGIYTLTAE
jgi:hypothetical protein